MKRITVDKIGSSTANVPLGHEIRLSDEIYAEEGYIVAGRIHGVKTVYRHLENQYGRMVQLHEGDVVVGTLGHRNALHCYTGYVPDALAVGDHLQVLNVGGVIGRCTSANPAVGKPFDFELLGTVLTFPDFGTRNGVPAHVSLNAPAKGVELTTASDVPIVVVIGTSMNSGKTTAICELIRYCRRKGLRVGACKLTGVSSIRDKLEMSDHGACETLSFMDAGIVTTNRRNAVEGARSVLAHLSSRECDLIVAEFGDGILGEYGVSEILAESDIKSRIAALVLCASDPVGAWGGVTLLREQFGLEVNVVSGPTTDNAAGTKFLSESMGIKAFNALKESELLGAAVGEACNV